MILFALPFWLKNWAGLHKDDIERCIRIAIVSWLDTVVAESGLPRKHRHQLERLRARAERMDLAELWNQLQEWIEVMQQEAQEAAQAALRQEIEAKLAQTPALPTSKVPMLLDAYELAPQGFVQASEDYSIRDHRNQIVARGVATLRVPEFVVASWMIPGEVPISVQEQWSTPILPRKSWALEIPQEYETTTSWEGASEELDVDMDRLIALEGFGPPTWKKAQRGWLIQQRYRVRPRLKQRT